eukprot:1159596-Pelagomonas_calceolata.AAC.11
MSEAELCPQPVRAVCLHEAVHLCMREAVCMHEAVCCTLVVLSRQLLGMAFLGWKADSADSACCGRHIFASAKLSPQAGTSVCRASLSLNFVVGGSYGTSIFGRNS